MKIKSYLFSPDRGIDNGVHFKRQERGEMTVQEVADALKVSPMTVHRLIRRKVLPAKQLCVGAPWIIHKDDLDHPALRQLLQHHGPLPPDPNQMAIDFHYA